MRGVLWLAGLSVLMHPVFFFIYRLSIFNTVPRDDYAHFLLWTVGHAEGVLPDSPYAYRVLSMVLAIPFYWVLPGLGLTNMPEALSPAYVRATAALSALAFVAWIAGALLIHFIAVARCGMSRRDGALAAALMLAVGLFGQIAAIDTLTFALVALGIALADRRGWFIAFVLISVVLNEKIALVLAIWLTVRCVLNREDRRALLPQWGAALVALAVYVALIRIVAVPGNSYQIDPGNYVATVFENLRAYASLRGMILNVVPVAILLAIAGFGGRAAGRMQGGLFSRLDILVIPILIVVALVLTQLFQAGRIVMHAAPLFAIPFVAALGPWLDAGAARRPARAGS